MDQINQSHTHNQFLTALMRDDLNYLIPYLKHAHLKRGTTLFSPEQEIRQVWFPESCVVSLIITMREGSSAQAATIGSEGAVGLVTALGGHRALSCAVVQIAGDALRLPVNVLHKTFEASPNVRQRCLCYADALFAQVLQSSACSALHPVEARLCRWLLQLQDRAGEPMLPLTHDLLAEMLGVHRTTITVAARALQRAGLITYQRGQVMVLDRAGLEKATCECYTAIRAYYERLLPCIAH